MTQDNETARKAKEEAFIYWGVRGDDNSAEFYNKVVDIAQKPLIERIAQLEKENKELKEGKKVRK